MNDKWLTDDQIKDLAERSVEQNGTPVKVTEILMLCLQSYERNRLREGLENLEKQARADEKRREKIADDPESHPLHGNELIGMSVSDGYYADRIRELLEGGA